MGDTMPEQANARPDLAFTDTSFLNYFLRVLKVSFIFVRRQIKQTTF